MTAPSEMIDSVCHPKYSWGGDNDVPKELTIEEIRKIHAQFGHADVATISRIVKNAKVIGNVEFIRAVVQACKCNRSSGPGGNPEISCYQSDTPGETIFIDTFPPSLRQTQEHPSMIIVCSLSRFICARFIQNNRPSSFISILANRWAVLFGYPKRIVCDSSTSFIGPLWNSMSNTFNITVFRFLRRRPINWGWLEGMSG